MPAPQYKYFLLTIPHHAYMPYLPEALRYVRGQLEQGGTTGYLHWQSMHPLFLLSSFIVLCEFNRKCTVGAAKQLFGDSAHIEPARSKKARDYVWKDDTAVAGTRFELGQQSFNPASGTDWDRVWDLGKRGNFDEIPASIRLRHYTTLKKIRTDHQPKPDDLDTVCGTWIYGEAGNGKSHLAREMAPNAFIKPQNKWWDGYQNQDDVLLDDLDTDCLGHYIKIWADKYSFVAEVKGGSMHIRPKRFLVTSQYLPEELFKCPRMAQAVRRRFTFIHKLPWNALN